MLKRDLTYVKCQMSNAYVNFWGLWGIHRWFFKKGECMCRFTSSLCIMWEKHLTSVLKTHQINGDNSGVMTSVSWINYFNLIFEMDLDSDLDLTDLDLDSNVASDWILNSKYIHCTNDLDLLLQMDTNSNPSWIVFFYMDLDLDLEYTFNGNGFGLRFYILNGYGLGFYFPWIWIWTLI